MQNPTASFSDIVGSAVTLKTINDDDPPATNTPDEVKPKNQLAAKFDPEDIDF